MSLMVLAMSLSAYATPKRLDLKKLLSQPQQKRQEVIPARAGWDGPEQSARPNTLVQHAEAPQNVWASVLPLLVPDWRIAAILTALVLILRVFRKTTPEQQPASYEQPPSDMPRAA